MYNLDIEVSLMTVQESISKMIKQRTEVDKIITKSQLGTALGVTPQAVNKWIQEGGFKIERVPELCALLQITPNELFEFTNDDVLSLEEKKIIQAYRESDMKDAVKRILNVK